MIARRSLADVLGHVLLNGTVEAAQSFEMGDVGAGQLDPESRAQLPRTGRPTVTLGAPDLSVNFWFSLTHCGMMNTSMPYSPSWFMARIGPLDGPRSRYSPGGRCETWSVGDQRVEIWASSPGLLAVDDESRVAVLLHGDLYVPKLGPRALLEAYLSQGESLLGSLNGSFAVLVSDWRRDRVYVATDRFSSRKVFLSEENGAWWLSSTLARHPTSGRALSPGGIGSLLSSGVAHGDLTPFEGVRKLGPASLHTFTGIGLSVERYWEFSESGGLAGRTPDQLRKQLVEVMRSGVERRLSGSGDVFVSLSGGHDSRAVGGFLAGLIDDRRRVRSFTYHHGPPVGDTDAGAARAVAAQLGFRHEIVEAYRGDVIGVIAANAAARQGIANFCLEADAWTAMGPVMAASDENLLFVADITLFPPLGVATAVKGGTPESVLASVDVYPISTVEYFVSLLDPEAGDALRNGWGNHYTQLLDKAASHPDQRIASDHLYIDQRVPNTLMPWREFFQTPYVRVANPILDNDVVDLKASIPVELRADKLLYRQAIAEALPGIFDIPVSPGGWNPPDWASELRASAGAIRDLLRSSSRLDELIPPDAIVRLLEAGLAPPTARGDDAIAGLKTLVRHSAPLRRVVRALKPRVQPVVRRRRPWERLMLDLLSLRGFLASQR